MPESTTDLSRIPFSILELASVPQGSNIPATLKQVIRHAQQADLLGFHRIWLAEHHNLPSAVSSATSVLIAQVAAQTRRLKVGSGGIMLANHSPLVIAEQFGTLEALHPGRIDLGLGRAPTYDPVTARALRRDPMREDHFAEEVEEVRALLGTDSSNRAVQAWPGSNSQVPVFLLGSSLFTARIAARKGLPYAFAGHLSPRYAHEALSLYRQQFQPSDVLNEPYSILTLPAVAAETDEQAEFLATTLKQKAWNLMHGKPDRLTPPIADLELNWDQRTVEQVDSFLQLAVIGSPSTLRRKLSAIVEEYPVNELMFTSDIFDAGMRIDALQHLMAASRSHCIQGSSEDAALTSMAS